MSTTPGPPRRRKIAGERRPARPVSAPADGPVATPAEPVDAESSAPSAPPAPPAAPPPSPSRARTRPAPEAAVPETAPEDAPAPEGRPRRRRGPDWWGSTPVVVALGALLFALVVAVVLGATGHLGGQSISEAHATRADAAAWDEASSAPSTAERAAESILAYDYRSLETSEKEATQFMTSDYAKQYTETFEKIVMPAAKQQKARVTADVQASSVIRATPGKARVLLFVDQTTQSVANRGPQQALNRVEMVMVRREGSWKVDAISSY